MGINSCPQRLQVEPNSAARQTRFTSAIPSSMCSPWAPSLHFRRRSVSSANQSCRSLTDQTPVLLIHPPRLIDEATPGLSVTTRRSTSGGARLRSSVHLIGVTTQQPLVFLIRHSFESFTQLSSTRLYGESLDASAPLAGEHLPVCGCEHSLPPCDLNVRDYSIK
jgi:hypothetical protein